MVLLEPCTPSHVMDLPIIVFSDVYYNQGDLLMVSYCCSESLLYVKSLAFAALLMLYVRKTYESFSAML